MAAVQTKSPRRTLRYDPLRPDLFATRSAARAYALEVFSGSAAYRLRGGLHPVRNRSIHENLRFPSSAASEKRNAAIRPHRNQPTEQTQDPVRSFVAQIPRDRIFRPQVRKTTPSAPRFLVLEGNGSLSLKPAARRTPRGARLRA